MLAAIPTRKGDPIGPLRILLVAAFFIPVILFVTASVFTYRSMVETARFRVAQLSEVSSEHTARILATSELVLDRIADRAGTMSWDEIRHSVALHDFLVEMKKNLPQANAIGLVDGDGRIVSTDYAFPAPALFIAHQNYLASPRDANPNADGGNDDDIAISDLAPGPRTGKPVFSIARHKPGSDPVPGRNLINIAIQPAALLRYYDSIAGDKNINFFLLRADGVVLVKDPKSAAPARLASASPFIEAIHSNPDHGDYAFNLQSNGARRLIAYRKIPDFPVYMVVGIDRDAIVGEWLWTMGLQLVYGLPATVALILVTLTAIRRTRHEQVAVERARNEVEKREMVEKQYQQAQKLEAVGQLTGGIAHDFNNLLTVVSGNLDLLERHVTSEAGKRMISAMQRAAGRGARLTQSLLAFSRKQPLRPETVNPNRLINEFGDLLRRATGEVAEIQFLLSPTLDPCRIDPAQFQSALLNLVVNARDAIHKPGGKITIQTENLVFDERHPPPVPEIPTGRYIAVSVIDNGDGMPPEVLEHVFEPFFTTKEVGKGSGLGLAQLYGFVKQSGGYVHISSDVGIGTQVSLYLPPSSDRNAAEEGAAKRIAAENRTRAARILMVEDDAEVREVVAAELQDLGYHVTLAEDGLAALEILERGTEIDLLFSDVVMPKGIRGDELARRARRMRPGLKIVLTSGYSTADLELRRSIREFGMLAKPYRAEDLARIIEEHLAR